MINRGWVLRSPIIGQREAAMPEPTAKDRPWRTYELIFMFSKSQHYHLDRNALANNEDIWTISTRPKSSNGLHAAAYPEELVNRCLAVGCPEGGEVSDPFVGTGTTLEAAVKTKRPAVGIDLNQEFCEYSARRMRRP